jgi:hypothetical protein
MFSVVCRCPSVSPSGDVSSVSYMLDLLQKRTIFDLGSGIADITRIDKSVENGMFNRFIHLFKLE